MYIIGIALALLLSLISYGWFHFSVRVGTKADSYGRDGLYWFLASFILTPVVTYVILKHVCGPTLSTKL